ncbi:hypothetical protein [Halococcus salsus]|uniref:hypothetical protein n=1 Tax=Halococcus salsus TaxID=2162894 RepID=UPI001359532A|nr:hypothetical protein [Halococcus salsus]
MEKVSGRKPGGVRWEAELSIPLYETIQILKNDDNYAEQYGDIADEIASEL